MPKSKRPWNEDAKLKAMAGKEPWERIGAAWPNPCDHSDGFYTCPALRTISALKAHGPKQSWARDRALFR